MIDIKHLIDNTLLILPPMAGYTEAACRALAIEFGASLTFTEMVSAKGLLYGNETTATLLLTTDAERIKGVQLFGSEPEVFKEVISYPDLAKFDIIDINMGCPVHKIVKNGEGSALLSTPELIYGIVSAAKTAADGRAVTVKMRLGIKRGEFLAVTAAQAAATAGADMLTVHGRYREDFYGGSVDLEGVAKVVESVKIPVVVNGDITDIDSYRNAMRVTGAAGAAIGRGALGRYSIFNEIRGINSDFSHFNMLLRHVEMLRGLYSERTALGYIKAHLSYYFRGQRGLKKVLAEAIIQKTADDLVNVIKQFLFYG